MRVNPQRRRRTGVPSASLGVTGGSGSGRGRNSVRVIDLRLSSPSITQKHILGSHGRRSWSVSSLVSFFWTISHPFSLPQVRLRRTTEVIIFLRIPVPSVRVSQYPRDSWWHLFSFLSYTMHPLPSASFSIHSQSTPVVEKLRVERVHLIP